MPTRAPDRPRPVTGPRTRPEDRHRVRTRRAVVLLLLSVLVPGAAQFTAGDRRIGRVVLWVWLGFVATATGLAALWFTWRDLVLRLVMSTTALVAGGLFCFVAAAGVAALVVDAWRLARPGELPRRARLGLAALAVVAVVAGSYPYLAVGQRAWAAADLISSVFGDGRASDATDGRFNVLLLGGDAGRNRIGTRPDSITLASIDASTGRTVLFSLPRNLQNVPFPPGTAAAAALPGGYSCVDTCLLNGLYTWGAEHRSLFGAAPDPGAEAMKQAVSGITGLTVHHYVLIDLAGFEQLIDAMGGITVRVGGRVPIGGETSRVSGYLEPGRQRLDGYHALWFARSRHGASDYARMSRQRCVMDAMLHQLDPATALRRFQRLAAASKEVVSTDIPAGDLATFLELATRARGQQVTSVQFVPPLINPARPDLATIRGRLASAIAASRKPPQPPRAPAPVTTSVPGGSSSGGSASGSELSGSELSAVCNPG